MGLFEYIVEIISIAISIKILTKIGNFLKDMGLFSTNNIMLDWIIKFAWWWIVLFVMLFVWAIFGSIFVHKTGGDWEFLILFSSINGFSSKYFGKTAFWVLLVFTFLIGVAGVDNNAIGGIIVAMLFFFTTRGFYEGNKDIENKSNLKNKSENDMDLLNTYLLKAKELSSKALNDFQNNNLNDAIERWTESLEYYKKAEKIAKSNKDEELISSIHNNIKLLVHNILDAKIKLISDKIERMV